MKKHGVSIFLLLACALVFASCAKVVENGNFDTDGYILIDGEEVVPDYVMMVADNAISFAEYRYYYLNQKAELDGGDESIWTKYPEYVDILKDYVEDTLIEIYSIRTLAEENEVSPDFEKVSAEIKEYKEGLSAEEYKEGLGLYHLTDELYEYILQGYDLYTTLFDYYFGEDGALSMTDSELVEYLEENYTRAKHILIYPNTTMSDAEYEAYLNSVLERAHNTDDFDALIAEYSNDSDMPDYGYYFTEGEMPDEFSLACDQLDYGEISGLVKSSYGYHIIKKLPVDTADLSSLKNVVYNQIFTEMIEEKIESIEVDYASEYEHIAPHTVK